MPQDSSDSDLLRRIARRDATAVPVFFARHNVRVYRFIVRLVRNEAVAEELTSEVFLQVWRNAPSFEGRSTATTWLLSIARNLALSHLRKRSEINVDDESVPEPADDADSPEIEVAKRDKADLMRACIDRLSPDHREIIDLVYYQELSVKEAGEVLEIPENTVKTRMFYARKQLSALFSRYGVDRGWP